MGLEPWIFRSVVQFLNQKAVLSIYFHIAISKTHATNQLIVPRTNKYLKEFGLLVDQCGCWYLDQLTEDKLNLALRNMHM